MKTLIQLTINTALLLAVVVLYFLHFQHVCGAGYRYR
jgi:hypothetical protein